MSNVRDLVNHKLSSLDDVDLSGLSIGQGLVWNGTLFVPGNVGGAGGSYTLPPATQSVLGGVKVGAGLSVAGDGTLTADAVTNGTTAGAVGTYAILARIVPNDAAYGSTEAASNLRFSGFASVGVGWQTNLAGTSYGYMTTPVPSGTWRCLGYSKYSQDTDDCGVTYYRYGTTLWVRIA